jgi:flagellar FliL protein
MAEERPKRPRKKRDAAEEAPPAKGGGKTIIIAAAVAALMLGLGVGVGFFVGDMLSDKDQVATEEGADAEAEEPEEVEEDRYNVYGSVGKLLANIDDQGAVRYIQAEVDIVSYEKDVIDEAQHDMPAIRNRLLVLFSSQKYDEVKTIEGRESLRQASIDAVNEVLGTTRDNGIHDVFFTAFIIQ